MAYNYFPNNYQPYNNYQASQQLIWVQGEGAAKSYPVAPNTSVPLWDSEQNVIYIKSADSSGMPSIKILDYKVRDVAQKTAEIQPQQDFVTRNELVDLKKEIEALKAKFERRKTDAK